MVTGGIDIDSDTMFSLASNPKIVGTKLSDANIGKVNRLCSELDQTSNFAVYAGKSDVFLQGLLGGMAGGIAALVNFAPKAHAAVYELAKEGRWEEATKIQAHLAHADWEVGKSGGVSGLKTAVVNFFGYGTGQTRRPLKTLSSQTISTNEVLMKRLGDLKKIEDSL
jgi:4-hydroxy-2-oxoglutarate aldolase